MNIVPVVTPRPGLSDFHVVPSSRGWYVEREGTPFPFSLFSTQKEAISEGVVLAKSAVVSLVIHGVDGRFRDVRSY